MSDSETARKVFEVLKLAEQAPAQDALPMLNGLAGLIQGGGEKRRWKSKTPAPAPSSRSAKSERRCIASNLQAACMQRRSVPPSDGCSLRGEPDFLSGKFGTLSRRHFRDAPSRQNSEAILRGQAPGPGSHFAARRLDQMDFTAAARLP